MLSGAYLWGFLADTYGRKKPLMAALLMDGIFSLISSFLTFYWPFLICSFFCGFGWVYNRWNTNRCATNVSGTCFLFTRTCLQTISKKCKWITYCYIIIIKSKTLKTLNTIITESWCSWITSRRAERINPGKTTSVHPFKYMYFFFLEIADTWAFFYRTWVNFSRRSTEKKCCPGR